MIRDMIQFIGETVFAQIGLIIFVIAFAATLIWTFSGRRDRFKRQSNLPLEDGTVADGSSVNNNHHTAS